MADKISEARRSWNMSRIRSRDTKPELLVRRLVHALGFRYRLGGCGLSGKPDLVFNSRKAVIFVHGCFWHQHEGCVDCSKPEQNRGYWSAKLARNVERDQKVRADLISQGWRVLVIWECEVRRTDVLAPKIKQFLDS